MLAIEHSPCPQPLRAHPRSSLVWKPPAGAELGTRRYGYISGYRRVWYQSSTDHRGTPEAPGTVVTLVADDTPGARVWGVAARISESDDVAELAQIMADLDHREKQYDTRLKLSVVDKDGVVLEDCLTYIGTPAGDNWAGERPLHEIAANIASAVGPSGPNDEYLCARTPPHRRAIPCKAAPCVQLLDRLS